MLKPALAPLFCIRIDWGLTMKSFHSIPALMLGLSAALPANANTGDSNENDAANNTVVITATRTEQSLDSTLAATTVITREDIERYQARDLPELLNRVVGLTITSNGAKGSAASIFTRGTNSNHTLIIVDGQRINSATLGSTAFQFINPDQIERIEIVRGARASLYGSDAIGGVIQIFTKQGSQKAKGLVKVATGTNNTQEIQLGAQGGFEKTQFNLNHSYIYSGGFDSTVSKDPLSEDDDAYINKSLNTNITHQLNDRVSVSASYLQNRGENEFDRSSQGAFGSFEIETIQLSTDIEVNEYLGLTAKIGKATDLSTDQNEEPDSTTDTFETNRTSAALQAEIAFTDQQTIVVAHDYFDDKVVDSTMSNRKTESDILQYIADFEYVSVATSIRQDRIEHIGTEVTESIDFGFHVTPSLLASISWGSAFRAPTVSDLSANPDVDPESSINREFGLKGTGLKGQDHQFKWQVSAFQNRINQLIAWSPDAAGTWKPGNIDKAEIKGVELSFSTILFDWQLSSNATYIDAEDATTHTQLLRRPKQTLNVDLDRRWQKVSFGTSLHASNERFDFGDVEIAGFGTVDLRTAYHCNDELKFQFSVTNLFDQDYQLVNTYNTEGVGAMLAVVYQPVL
ncbi:MAG: hypothetical protein COB51_01595 [Moraxellaceae bacterium]|nr:MAG: hypothetical protein COB51_01595 [Moraxellaceae bacterium]